MALCCTSGIAAKVVSKMSGEKPVCFECGWIGCSWCLVSLPFVIMTGGVGNWNLSIYLF